MSEMIRAMDLLAADPNVLFLGQSVIWPGNVIYKTISHISESRRIELPVFEETQMGMSLGFALSGYVPVSIYPRYNFLLLAMNQLVNHLDKFSKISRSRVQPKVIIRTSIGSVSPLFPGPQHSGDFTDAFRMLLTNVEVIRLDEPDQIVPAYNLALNRTDGKSTIIAEFGDYYNEK